MIFRSSGDAGDCIQNLAVIRALGGKHKYCLVNRSWTKPMSITAPFLQPLIESQPYISSCEVSEEEPEVDFSLFRHGRNYRFHSAEYSLAEAHARYYKFIKGERPDIKWNEPWLENIKPDKRSKGRVVIARSERYNNSAFQWRKIVEHYGDLLLFIGTEKERNKFCQFYGNIEYAPTKDLLEAAELIAGSALFIGNQSSPYNVAEGLRVPRILEACDYVVDVITFLDPKAQYCGNGKCTLPAIGLKPAIDIEPPPYDPTQINLFEVPPSGWRFPSPEYPSERRFDLKGSTSSDIIVRVMNAYGIDKEDSKKRVCQHLIDINTNFYVINQNQVPDYHLKQAIANAPK